MEYVYNVSIACGLIKTKIFSQEIFHKERIPAGSHKENYTLLTRATKSAKHSQCSKEIVCGKNLPFLLCDITKQLINTIFCL